MTTFSTNKDILSLVPILSCNRSQGSRSHAAFLADFITPVFGKPVDGIGNYILRAGTSDTMFCAHHDTVDTRTAPVKKRLAFLPPRHIILHPEDTLSGCLGADDGAGIWLMLEMIKAKVPGIYALFADEERGCQGSAVLDSAWLKGVRKVIGFDRPGTTEIVTHMAGRRVCSDAFAKALSDLLGMGHVVSNSGGLSDPAELSGRGDVVETTNLAIGYTAQHSARESLDVDYLFRLRDAMVAAAEGFQTLPTPGFVKPVVVTGQDDLDDLVWNYPEAAADMLRMFGVDADTFFEYLKETKRGERL